MAIRDIKGGAEVERKFGPCAVIDFTEIRILSVETYYEEDNERFEKMLTLVLRGPKGQVEFRFGGVQEFQIKTLDRISGFDIINITNRQLEDKRFFFYDPIKEELSGYCNIAEVLVCENQFI